MHYLLLYEVVDDYVARRAQHRQAHLALAWEGHQRGEIVLGGAFGDPVEGVAIVFSGDSPTVAEEFARADPYVTNGLVTSWRVREWKTVVGALAAQPVRPENA